MKFRVSEVLKDLQHLSNAPTVSIGQYQKLFIERCDERLRNLDYLFLVECDVRAEILQHISQEVDFELSCQYRVKGGLK